MTVDGIIPTQGVPNPIIRHHDAGQPRMIAEDNAKKVEDFALVPISALENARYGLDLLALAQAAFHG
jgi:hypothetical protein